MPSKKHRSFYIWFGILILLAALFLVLYETSPAQKLAECDNTEVPKYCVD